MGNGSPAALAGSPLMKNMEISSVQSGQQMKLLSPADVSRRLTTRAPWLHPAPRKPPLPFSMLTSEL